MRVWCCAVIALGGAISVSVSAQSRAISFPEALAIARAQSPDAVVARARIDEIRGRLAGARVRFRENLTFEAFAGPRRGDGSTTPDLDVGFNQLFETGGQRAARIAGAGAAIDAEQATTEDVTRRAVEAVARAFFRTVHAQERLRLLTETETTAQQILQIATRRYQSGDIAVLDVNTAKTALTRARSTRLAADADRLSAAGELVRLLALPADSTIVADGTLTADRSIDLSRLIAAVDNRPDFRTLEAALGEAEAEIRLARGQRRPDVGVGVRASREGRDHILVAGLTVALPMFNSGQELLATGTARAGRIRIELETTRAAAVAEVRTLYEAQRLRAAAAAAYEEEALPGAAENEQLAERSFEVGQLTLADLLVVRRELTDTRLEYLDRLLESVETAVRRDAAAGVLQ